MLHNETNCSIWNKMIQMHRRSLTVRCSLETAEVISRVAQLIGWSEGKIAAHLLDRAVPILIMRVTKRIW